MDHHQRHPYQQHHHHLHHHVAHRRLPHSHPLHVQAEQTQFTNQHEQIVHLPETKVVYFCVGHKEEVAKFSSDTQAYLIKELFRSAAEAGPSDVLKLYDAEGHLMNISGELSSNSPTSRYNLEVVATHTNGMLLEEVGVDLAALEARVVALEQALCAEQDILPLGVRELKQQVEEFRHKLENTEHLSWLGFHKQLPTPISSEECRRLQYRRKSDTVKKRVKERFMQISDTEVSERIRQWLRMPTFDSRQWEDEEVLLLLQTMFVDLDLCSRFAIDLHTLRTFLYEVYKNYNEVPFHNFRHCFCVAQMMYAITWAVNLPSKIGDLEILILIVSCICHDLDHPGYNNIYQINAKTELALRYNDISPLENHHCSVAFRLLENDDCNIFKSFSNETFKQVREGMIRCILATDMARHNEILAQFKEITPEFDYTNKAHINLLTMVLIKVADISNEARPMDVAEPWLDRLLQEFFKQSDAEKLEGLPVTPFMDREKITKPSSQCSFIGFVLLPLFEALGDLLTELQDLIVQPVRDALDYYRRLNEATKEERLHRKSVVAELLDHPALAHSHPTCPQPPFSNACQNQQSAVSPDINSSEGTSATSVTPPTMVGNVPKSVSNHSVKSKKSISFQQTRSRSRSTDEEFEQSIEILHSDEDQNLADLVEDNESGDSETATEVEVSEKTLKFKISTEGNIASAGRKSYPGSRKGSRDRTQHTTCSELAKALQKEKERGRLGPAAVSFDGRIPGNRMSLDMSDNYDGLKKFHGKSLDGRGRYSGLSTPTSGKSVNFLEDDEFKALHLRPTKENNVRASDEKIAEKSLRTSEKVIFSEKITSLEDDSKLSKIKTDTKLSKEDVSLKCNELKTTDLDEIFVEKISEINRKGMEKAIDTQNGKMSQTNNTRSFLARIKQFTDKFNISLDKDSKGSKLNSDDNVSRNNNGNTTKTFGTKCRKFETNCCRKVSIDDYTEVKKASTLPKIQKKCSESKKLGWKNLISVSNKDIKSNSVEVLPSDKESVEILKPKQNEDRLSLESPCTSYKTQRNAPGVDDFDGTRTPNSPNSPNNAATKHERANVNQTRNQSGRMDDQSRPEQNPSQGTNISLIQRVRDDDRFRSSKDNI